MAAHGRGERAGGAGGRAFVEADREHRGLDRTRAAHPVAHQDVGVLVRHERDRHGQEERRNAEQEECSERVTRFLFDERHVVLKVFRS